MDRPLVFAMTNAEHNARFIAARLAWQEQVVFVTVGSTAMVPLAAKHGVRKWAAIDAADIPLVRFHKWCYRTRPNGGMYARTRAGEMHRVITGFRSNPVDHRDGNGLNNLRSNLRPCGSNHNAMNRKKPRGGSSRYKGVCYRKDRGGVWLALITVADKQKLVGRFSREEDAARAYDNAARELFGEFARLNFPRNGEQAALHNATARPQDAGYSNTQGSSPTTGLPRDLSPSVSRGA